MRFASSVSLASALLLAGSLSAHATPRVHRGPTSPRVVKSHTHAVRAPHVAGIAPERATQIQAALIKSGYMTGAPSGQWDSTTQAAMEKMQADNGWQTKLVPDSRAIIKLGLGPGSTPAVVAGSPAGEPEALVSGGSGVGVDSN